MSVCLCIHHRNNHDGDEDEYYTHVLMLLVHIVARLFNVFSLSLSSLSVLLIRAIITGVVAMMMTVIAPLHAKWRLGLCSQGEEIDWNSDGCCCRCC